MEEINNKYKNKFKNRNKKSDLLNKSKKRIKIKKNKLNEIDLDNMVKDYYYNDYE